MTNAVRASAVAPYGPMLANVTLTALRVMAGLLFMQHGAQKLLGALGGVDGAGMKVELATTSVGVDDNGLEAVGFGFRPIS